LIKKVIILALFLCLYISPFAQPGPELGDVDWDGDICIVDALIIAQYYIGLNVSLYTEVADVNCDHYIDVVDALLVAQYYVGEVDGFPSSTFVEAQL
jgi:hypothetical protein